jgi:uncharacterized membrane protein YhhN
LNTFIVDRPSTIVHRQSSCREFPASPVNNISDYELRQMFDRARSGILPDNHPQTMAQKLAAIPMLDRTTLVFAYVCGAGCVALVAGLLLDQALFAAAAKLLASTAFIATAISAGALASRYGAIILAGLVFAWLGDAFLIGTSERWFLFGLVSFLLAHVAYITAFIGAGTNRNWTLGAALPVIVIAMLVLFWLAPHVPGSLAWPVRIYTSVISLMVITAFGTLGAGASPLIVAGACLFFISDLSVAAMRFTDPLFPTFVLGLPLYYMGQLCLALSVASTRPLKT